MEIGKSSRYYADYALLCYSTNPSQNWLDLLVYIRYSVPRTVRITPRIIFPQKWFKQKLLLSLRISTCSPVTPYTALM